MAPGQTLADSQKVSETDLRKRIESWDGTFFTWTWPEIYFQMRRPVVEPEGECLELGKIHLRVAEKMGYIPEIPEALHAAAKENRLKCRPLSIWYVQNMSSTSWLMITAGNQW